MYVFSDALLEVFIHHPCVSYAKFCLEVEAENYACFDGNDGKDCVCGSGPKEKLPAQLYVVCKGDVGGCLQWGSDLVGSGCFTPGSYGDKKSSGHTSGRTQPVSCFVGLGNGSMTSEPLSGLSSFWPVVLHQIAVIVGKEDE